MKLSGFLVAVLKVTYLCAPPAHPQSTSGGSLRCGSARRPSIARLCRPFQKPTRAATARPPWAGPTDGGEDRRDRRRPTQAHLEAAVSAAAVAQRP